MKLISTKDYELTTIRPKMANPSITRAGIKVIMNSLDITFLSPILPRICIVNPFWN